MYRIFLAAILVLSFTVVARASEEDWQVAKASQQVNYTVDKVTWKPAKVGDIVPNRAWISTGPRGRVQLVRGVESMTFQPNTLAGLFTESGLFERKTEIYQQVGTIDLEIETRNKPHTTVQTPFLAAVVKGTNFRVEVTKRNADVSVNRGLVQVTSFSSGQRADVGPGQSADVDTSRGLTVSGAGTPPSISSVAPSAARVPAIGSTKTLGPKADVSSTASPNASPQTRGSASKGNSVTDGEKRGGKNGKTGQGNSGNSGNNGQGNGGSSSNSENGGSGHGGQGNGNGGAGGNNNSGNGSSSGNSGNGGNGNSGNGGQGNGQGNNGQGNGNGGSSGNNNSGNGNSGNGNNGHGHGG